MAAGGLWPLSSLLGRWERHNYKFGAARRTLEGWRSLRGAASVVSGAWCFLTSLWAGVSYSTRVGPPPGSPSLHVIARRRPSRRRGGRGPWRMGGPAPWQHHHTPGGSVD